VEVGVDFTDEDVSFLSPGQIASRARQADAALELLIAESRRFEPLTHEPSVVLVGRPNAGKSTLLNALCGRDRAVVSPIAGTTRDVIWAEAALPRGLVRVVDAAGMDHEGPDDAERSVAAEIARAMRAGVERAIESANLLLLVVDATSSTEPPSLSRPPDLIVLSKVDLLGPRAHKALAPEHAVMVSAVAGLGMDALRSRLDALAFGRASGGTSDALALNERHRTAIADARAALVRAADQAAGATVAAELVALELREALDVLGSVTGQIAPDDVLGRVFAGFCIGK
jgi:tRNA modification GTPase